MLLLSVTLGGCSKPEPELFPAEIVLVRIEPDRPLAVVELYHALGGGWTDEPAVAGELRPKSAEVWPPWP